MARTPAVLNGPLEFMDLSTGAQIQLPLSAVYFEENKVKAEGPIYNAHKGAIDAWISHLAQSGLLKPDPDPVTKPAMKVVAKDPGASGSHIEVKIEKLVPDLNAPANTKFDATVSETNTYTGLKVEDAQAVLGSAAGKGTQPGLVFLPGAAPTDLPKAGEYKLAGDPAKADVPKNSGAGNAFTVEAKGAGADGDNTTVVISDVNETTKTFTVTVKWTKQASGIKASEMGTTFDYLLTVSAPEGSVLAPPAAGVYTLSGGADPVSNPPLAASAVLAAS